jgi:hypothetical protein
MSQTRRRSHSTPLSSEGAAASTTETTYDGEFVKVVGAHDQSEAEFLQGLLREEGVPSALRRTRGFDVPDFLAAGPRDVLVPATALKAARDALLLADLEPVPPSSSSGVVAPQRVLAGLLVAAVLAAFVVWLGTELVA